MRRTKEGSFCPRFAIQILLHLATAVQPLHQQALAALPTRCGKPSSLSQRPAAWHKGDRIEMGWG